MNHVTQLLSALEQGDPHAASRLLPLVHDELRRLVAQQVAREQPGQTLQATALVHEAYLRLVGQGDPDCCSLHTLAPSLLPRYARKRNLPSERVLAYCRFETDQPWGDPKEYLLQFLQQPVASGLSGHAGC
jgi:hypothetical protein